MMTIRRSDERGHADHGWLNAYHSFSFANYYDPAHMGFRSLRVINEDRIAPKKGFPTHDHDNMEIITYVIEGELAHKDSMGNIKTIRAGEFQAMTAGRGIEHSEYNPSQTSPTHLLQIWIVPDNRNLPPTYAEWTPESGSSSEKLTLAVSRIGGGAPLTIRQNALLFLGELGTQDRVGYKIDKDRHVWVQMIHGELSLNGEDIHAGDGVAVSAEAEITLRTANSRAKFLLFDLS